MNAEPHPQPKHQQQSGKQDLNSAVAACFARAGGGPGFPQRFAELVAALLPSRSVSLWHRPSDPASELSLMNHVGVAPDSSLQGTADEFSKDVLENRQTVQLRGASLCALLPVSATGDAVLVAVPAAGGATAVSLAYERLSLLVQLCHAHWRNPDLSTQSKLIASVQEVFPGQDKALRRFADSVAEATDANFAAVGFWQSGKITDVTISGQSDFVKRANLPTALRTELEDIARQSIKTERRMLAENPGTGPDLVILLDEPKRAGHVLSLTAGLYAQFAPDGSRRSIWPRRLARVAMFALLGLGVGLVPIPDGTQVNATVKAVNQRIVTAPLTTELQDLAVQDGQSVRAGEVLLQLDAREAELELIRLQSERAAAVIEQETARQDRNAASLRNAELTVQRLDARIALEEDRKARAVLTSPIHGIVVLGDLNERIGSTVRQGDPLLEVSDPAMLELSLSILATDIGKVSAGDTAEFRPDYDPAQTHAVEIQNVSPAIDLNAEVPVAPAEARFDTVPEGLRPGLTGIVHVGDERTPIWRVVYRTIRDWILLRVWL